MLPIRVSTCQTRLILSPIFTRASSLTPQHFAWQAWLLATSRLPLHAGVLLGDQPSLCLAGMALTAPGCNWGRVWSPLVARGGAARFLCLGGLGLGAIGLHFAQRGGLVAVSHPLCLARFSTRLSSEAATAAWASISAATKMSLYVCSELTDVFSASSRSQRQASASLTFFSSKTATYRLDSRLQL